MTRIQKRREWRRRAVAAAIKAQGGANLTTKQVAALVPDDWRELTGKFAHANIAAWCAKKHSIEITYVAHDDGGFHFAYRAKEEGGST